MQTVNPILANALDLLKQGNTELAEKEFGKAVTACCTAFGETDIVTARTLAHLARICASRGKVDMAVPMYRRVVCIHEALPQPSNGDHAVVLCELATLLEGSGSQDATADTLIIMRRKADRIMSELSERMGAVETESGESIADDDDGEEEEEEEEDEEESSKKYCQDDEDDSGGNNDRSDDDGPEVEVGVGGDSHEREDDSVQDFEQSDVNRIS